MTEPKDTICVLSEADPLMKSKGIPGEDPPPEQAPVSLNIDSLLENEVGPLGFWQWLVISLIVISGPSMAFFPVFVNAVPNMRCRMEPEVEQLFGDNKINFANASTMIGPPTGCSRYAYDWSAIKNMQALSSISVSDQQTEACPYGYVYEYTPFQYPSSIVADFDLVCSKTWLAPMGTSLYMIGMFLGYIIGGWFGDKFGRRYTAIGFALLELCFGIVVSVSPNHQIYHLSRMLVGIANTGRASILRILPLEITLAKYRGYFSSLVILGVLFFYRAVLAGLAYFIRDWRWLNAAAMSPCILCFSFFFLLPESPRWLNAQNRPADAVRVLQTGRKFNQLCSKRKEKSVELETLSKKLEASESAKSQSENKKQFKLDVAKQLKQSCCECHQLRELIVGTLLMNLLTLALYGVVLYARVIKDAIYIVALVNSLTAVPGPVIASLAYRLYRYRRLPLAICVGIAFVALSIGGLYTYIGHPASDTVLNVCCNCALIMYSASLVMLSTYLAELFPSGRRTRAMGIVSGFGRIGGSISTFVNQLDSAVGHGMPVILYAVASAIMLGLLFLVKDTSGENLQDVTDSKESSRGNAKVDDLEAVKNAV